MTRSINSTNQSMCQEESVSIPYTLVKQRARNAMRVITVISVLVILE